ncbi:Thiamine-phosphate synthase [Sinobacterium norvegicum]|uniref:Thiamine-phosphate synthase n=1 Tax=Sinobacterium norvegicum TaxID=1641715 RepID=A0ABN8EGS7_9GAMM|nr:thiamine phosphate synthase [Sinobacterium norvegicum]CAH0991547.1 Thiamine-phosphate synthase [Sinobacterium norvegicum]
MNKKPIVWTIAGSDSGGGAGIQADLATFNDFSVHGCTVITALTAQNSVAVSAIEATPVAHIQAEIAALNTDLPATAIKLGMLFNHEIINTVADFVAGLTIPVVCDPVMISTSGSLLLDEGARSSLIDRLFPHCSLITPNIPEAEALTSMVASSPEKIEEMAEVILASGAAAVLIKGGHNHFSPDNQGLDGNYCYDFFIDKQQRFWLRGDLIDNGNNHGSGCTLSSAIAALLARGLDIEDAVTAAKAYISEGIDAGEQLGQSHGPIAHMGFPSKSQHLPKLFKQFPKTKKIAFVREVDKLGLYPVVDSSEWVARLLSLGVKTIQLRVKDLSGDALRAEVEHVVALSQQYQARLYINDYWQLAIDCGAYGVHLGQEDLDDASVEAIAAAGLRLGVSTHAWSELARAHAIGPSYIAIGPIYSTTTKEMRFGPQGLQQLSQWLQVTMPCYPVVAIGGIDLPRAIEVNKTGVGSIALVSAITKAKDWRLATEQLIAAVGTGHS